VIGRLEPCWRAARSWQGARAAHRLAWVASTMCASPAGSSSWGCCSAGRASTTTTRSAADPDERPDGVPEITACRSTAHVAAHDAVIIATAHTGIDWDLVARAGRLVINTRGVLRRRAGPNVVTA
jgi:hypothetical protein